MREAIERWLTEIGDEYGVDPVVYAVIYVGALPFFLLSVGWTVRGLRRHESVVVPLLATALFFLAPTLYVFLAGRNLPSWVYVLLVALAVLGGAATARRIRRQLVRAE